MNKVFVYGTLKRGLSNHNYFLENTDTDYIGPAETVEKYGMVDLGAFPGVIKNVKEGVIQGELYAVSDDVFGMIDQLEGHPTFYKREEVDIVMRGPMGPMDTAWIYFLPDDGYGESMNANDQGYLNWRAS